MNSLSDCVVASDYLQTTAVKSEHVVIVSTASDKKVLEIPTGNLLAVVLLCHNL